MINLVTVVKSPVQQKFSVLNPFSSAEVVLNSDGKQRRT